MSYTFKGRKSFSERILQRNRITHMFFDTNGQLGFNAPSATNLNLSIYGSKTNTMRLFTVPNGEKVYQLVSYKVTDGDLKSLENWDKLTHYSFKGANLANFKPLRMTILNISEPITTEEEGQELVNDLIPKLDTLKFHDIVEDKEANGIAQPLEEPYVFSNDEEELFTTLVEYEKISDTATTGLRQLGDLYFHNEHIDDYLSYGSDYVGQSRFGSNDVMLTPQGRPRPLTLEVESEHKYMILSAPSSSQGLPITIYCKEGGRTQITPLPNVLETPIAYELDCSPVRIELDDYKETWQLMLLSDSTLGAPLYSFEGEPVEPEEKPTAEINFQDETNGFSLMVQSPEGAKVRYRIELNGKPYTALNNGEWSGYMNEINIEKHFINEEYLNFDLNGNGINVYYQAEGGEEQFFDTSIVVRPYGLRFQYRGQCVSTAEGETLIVVPVEKDLEYTRLDVWNVMKEYNASVKLQTKWKDGYVHDDVKIYFYQSSLTGEEEEQEEITLKNVNHGIYRTIQVVARNVKTGKALPMTEVGDHFYILATLITEDGEEFIQGEI